jgi:hypothetical protein
MRAALPHRAQGHASYRLHRRQRWTQILLPVILAVVLFVVLALLAIRAAVGANGDVSRWAAISTIWLVLPIMVLTLIALAALLAGIFLITRLTGMLPTYTRRAQRIFYRVESGARGAAEMTRRPVLFVKGLGSLIKSGIHRARERM